MQNAARSVLSKTIGKKSKITILDAADKSITVIDNSNEKITYNGERAYREVDDLWFSQDVFASNDLNTILTNDFDSTAISTAHFDNLDTLDRNADDSFTNISYSQQQKK